MNPEIASYPINYRFVHNISGYSLAKQFSQFKEFIKLHLRLELQLSPLPL